MGLLSDLVKSGHYFQQLKLGRMVADMFHRYEDVGRWTIGQFLYPLSLMLVVLFFRDLTVYSFAVLVLALSDGFAAVIGKTFGRRKYYVPGGYKTFIGSMTFFLITFTLLCVYLILETNAGVIALIPAVVYAAFLTIVEGGIAGGFDNLAVPLVTAVLLSTI
jgi:phytol kinase